MIGEGKKGDECMVCKRSLKQFRRYPQGGGARQEVCLMARHSWSPAVWRVDEACMSSSWCP